MGIAAYATLCVIHEQPAVRPTFLFLLRLLCPAGKLAWLAAMAGLMLLAAHPAQAVTLDKARLAAFFPPPLMVGDKDPELPVWPLFRQMRNEKGWDDPFLVGYAFESVDFAPVPGFSGTPVNLLIALDAKGVFLDVKVLSQHEPVWLFMRSGVLRQENRKQGVQGCLAASSDVVQALKEGQVEGEFFLGNPPVWAQPGAQQ